jgi:hypothetical protein
MSPTPSIEIISTLTLYLYHQNKMGFFDIATEIRLKIYSELLIASVPIEFVADRGTPSPPLVRSRKDGLQPAILRTSRQVYSEAVSLLYSKNRFRFPEAYGSTPSTPGRAHFAPFFEQIGSQASLIHHICIPFPTFKYPVPDGPKLYKVHMDSLELIRKTCTKLKTLELLIPPEHCNYALSDFPIAAEALNILNTQFKAINSFVLVNLEMYPECEPSDDLMKKMRDLGWSVMVTRLPEKYWIELGDLLSLDPGGV